MGFTVNSNHPHDFGAALNPLFLVGLGLYTDMTMHPKLVTNSRFDLAYCPAQATFQLLQLTPYKPTGQP